jgi:hypothetical protein
MSFPTTASKCHACQKPFLTDCVQKFVCPDCKQGGHDDALMCRLCEIKSHEAIIDRLLEEIEQLKEERRQKEHILGLLRDTKMEHGICQPRSRKACTACNAQELLDTIVKGWKGFTMELS